MHPDILRPRAPRSSAGLSHPGAVAFGNLGGLAGPLAQRVAGDRPRGGLCVDRGDIVKIIKDVVVQGVQARGMIGEVVEDLAENKCAIDGSPRSAGFQV